MSTDIREFPTLVVASCLTGIALTSMKGYGEVQTVAAHLLGAPIWTHELAYDPLMETVKAEGYRQFPHMPTREDAEADYKAAAIAATEIYGDTVSVRQGSAGRDEDPLTTLNNKLDSLRS